MTHANFTHIGYPADIHMCPKCYCLRKKDGASFKFLHRRPEKDLNGNYIFLWRHRVPRCLDFDELIHYREAVAIVERFLAGDSFESIKAGWPGRPPFIELLFGHCRIKGGK